MEGRERVLMDKYLKVLGCATGKEIDNIRAKMAWVLTEELFEEELGVPLSYEEISALLNEAFLKEFPFCQNLELNIIDSSDILVNIKGCQLKEANGSCKKKNGYSLCPIDPFLMFTLSRGLACNVWFVDVKPTDEGCSMEFSLKSQCLV
ncbi:MAG: hypothetical protein WDA53_00320 [Bacillota bacterium]